VTATPLTPEALQRAAEHLSCLLADGTRITSPEIPFLLPPPSALYLHQGGWKRRFGFEPTDRMFIVGDHLEVLRRGN
jgi:hypothetical protein